MTVLIRKCKSRSYKWNRAELCRWPVCQESPECAMEHCCAVANGRIVILWCSMARLRTSSKSRAGFSHRQEKHFQQKFRSLPKAWLPSRLIQNNGSITHKILLRARSLSHTLWNHSVMPWPMYAVSWGAGGTAANWGMVLLVCDSG